MDSGSKGNPDQYQLFLDDSLPVLPSVVRYYDDFEDKYNAINNLNEFAFSTLWLIDFAVVRNAPWCR